MYILIPLGGIGSRFKEVGYNIPKPLIQVGDNFILGWLLDNLDLKNVKKILIPYNKELSNFNFEEIVRTKYPHINFDFMRMDIDTLGAAESIYKILENKDGILDDDSILCLDGDGFYKINVIERWNNDNKIIVFEDDGEKPIYSYSEVDEEDRIKRIVEKERISDWASTGGYGFRSWKELRIYCKNIIDKDIRQKNEYYTSTVIQNMIEDGYEFKIEKIKKDEFICLGTPHHTNIFLNK